MQSAKGGQRMADQSRHGGAVERDIEQVGQTNTLKICPYTEIYTCSFVLFLAAIQVYVTFLLYLCRTHLYHRDLFHIVGFLADAENRML